MNAASFALRALSAALLAQPGLGALQSAEPPRRFLAIPRRIDPATSATELPMGFQSFQEAVDALKLSTAF